MSTASPARAPRSPGSRPSALPPVSEPCSRRPRRGAAPGSRGAPSAVDVAARPRRQLHRVAAVRRAVRRSGSRFVTAALTSSKTVVPSATSPSATPSSRRRRWRPRAARRGHRREASPCRRGGGGAGCCAPGAAWPGRAASDEEGRSWPRRRRRRRPRRGVRTARTVDPGRLRPRAGLVVGHAASQGSATLPARMRFWIRRRYAALLASEAMRVLVVEDEPSWPRPSATAFGWRRSRPISRATATWRWSC